MKKIFLLFFLFSILLSTSYSQERMRQGKDQRPLQRIEQWEKIKLIDALNLNEDTAIRFFARRHENQKKMKEILDQRDDAIKSIEDEIKNGNQNDASYKDKVNNLLLLEGSISKERENFLRSLSDLLSPMQIAKMMVFEHRFRKEVRETLMGKGKQPKDN
ncbi:MAG: hypothetical protein D4R68_02020 [Ignavibacteriales bacterium]|nr:MAG: hypothetical protein D4R68_02020 [Ignavibacteriales bacterium]